MTLPETSWPIVAASFVGSIGLLGIFAGIVACRQVSAEVKILDKGEDTLTDSVSTLNPDSADPVEWLASNDLPKDSHFGDHLLAVWCGWVGERLPSLAELHSLSARRERRRLSARISGGVTALLLICGIAGTLLCIHPILKSFTILKDADGNVLIDPTVAQELIRSLGSAFLPSLAALVFTVLVAIFRGSYIQATTGLAWRLDRFAVAQLFPFFKPKRFGSELTEVHFKLSRLVDRLEERDQKFGEGVEIFGKAALDLKESGPKLKAASDRISSAADRLASETVLMVKALETSLGENSALAKGTNSLKEALDTCQETTRELRKGSDTLASSLVDMSSKFEEARTKLDTSIASIPEVIQQGCISGSNALIEANEKSSLGAAGVIAKVLQSTAVGINSAGLQVQKDIRTCCADAGDEFKDKAKVASGHAAAKIAEVVVEAVRDIKENFEHVKETASSLHEQLVGAKSSIDKAAVDFMTTASEATNQAVSVFGEAGIAAAKSINEEIVPIKQVVNGLRGELDHASSSIGKVSEDFKATASDAANQAARIFGEAGTTAATNIKAEVEPITQLTSKMSKQLSDAAAIIAMGNKTRTPVPRPKRKLWKRVISMGILK